MYPINIIVKRSSRKTLSIEVNSDLEVIIRAPLRFSDKEIPEILSKYGDWIETAIRKRKLVNEKYPKPTKEEAAVLRKKAAEILPGKIEYFSKLTGLVPKSVKITGAEKRFGSCSSVNSLCFSYNLMRYPDECIDYVVLHEIAHIKHHNHSKDFYSFIEYYMPDYRERVKILKGKI